jgi:hypothetical protein
LLSSVFNITINYAKTVVFHLDWGAFENFDHCWLTLKIVWIFILNYSDKNLNIASNQCLLGGSSVASPIFLSLLSTKHILKLSSHIHWKNLNIWNSVVQPNYELAGCTPLCFYHRLKIYKYNASGVWNYSPSKYEVSSVFCSFLCVSLNVLVSFLYIYQSVYCLSVLVKIF